MAHAAGSNKESVICQKKKKREAAVHRVAVAAAVRVPNCFLLFYSVLLYLPPACGLQKPIAIWVAEVIAPLAQRQWLSSFPGVQESGRLNMHQHISYAKR